MEIVHEITKLRNAGLLVDWQHGVGIWRLKPETSGQFGQDVVVSEVLPQEEIDKRAEEMAKRYGEFDASVSREELD